MINVLFSSSEIKELKKYLENKKVDCINKDKIETLNGFYKVLSNIEKRNGANTNSNRILE